VENKNHRYPVCPTTTDWRGLVFTVDKIQSKCPLPGDTDMMGKTIKRWRLHSQGRSHRIIMQKKMKELGIPTLINHYFSESEVLFFFCSSKGKMRNKQKRSLSRENSL